MAAGAGFKTFNTGDVLSAADVNTYLMQGVWVFASAAARDAAVTSPQEGNFAYLKDTNVTTYYTGSAWANLDTTGMVNPMTTTGDTIYSSSGSTPARLGIGSTGQVLTVSGGLPVWATPAGGGGKVLQVVYGSTSTSASITSTTFTDTNLTASITPSANTSKVLILVAQTAYSYDNGTEIGGAIKLLRGSTDIFTPSTNGIGQLYLRVASNSTQDLDLGLTITMNYLDSPSTTSSTTYKTQGRMYAAGVNNITLQPSSNTSTMILMEIGA